MICEERSHSSCLRLLDLGSLEAFFKAVSPSASFKTCKYISKRTVRRRKISRDRLLISARHLKSTWPGPSQLASQPWLHRSQCASRRDYDPAGLRQGHDEEWRPSLLEAYGPGASCGFRNGSHQHDLQNKEGHTKSACLFWKERKYDRERAYSPEELGCSIWEGLQGGRLGKNRKFHLLESAFVIDVISSSFLIGDLGVILLRYYTCAL